MLTRLNTQESFYYRVGQESAPTAGRRRASSQAQTRDRLIAAAAQAIAAHGFAGAKVELIAAAAGYTKGAFYSNFRTKEEVAVAVLERVLEDDGKGIRRVLANACGDPETLFAAIADETRERHANAPLRALRLELLLHAWRDASCRAAATELYRKRRAGYAELVREGLRRIGRPEPRDAMLFSDLLLALDHGHSALRLGGAEPMPVEAVMHLALRVLADHTPP